MDNLSVTHIALADMQELVARLFLSQQKDYSMELDVHAKIALTATQVLALSCSLYGICG
jgi:hypothetical protein